MMPKHPAAATLRVCQSRAEIPGGSQLERERDFARTTRRQRLHLVSDELERAGSPPQDSAGFLDRLFQAIDLLRGRGKVWVERRHSRRD